MLHRFLAPLAAAAAVILAGAPARAEPPGVTATQIKIGQTIAYSGPASAYGILGKTEAAYFKSLNDRGGVNGRKIEFLSRDDGYQPPKAVENVRRLVEEDDVSFIFGVLGTPINMAIRPYLNSKKAPLLFIAAGSANFADPAHYPWTIGWQPTLRSEAKFYGEDIARRTPDAKIGVLYQNDDFGKEMLAGLKLGLGDKADKHIVSAQSFLATDPTIDSQLLLIKNSGANVLCLFTYAKQASQAIKKMAELGWKPATYLHLGAASIGATFKPAGLDNSVGVMTAGFMKDPTDPKWAADPAVKDFHAWLQKYMPGADANDWLIAAAYSTAQTLEQVLKQAGGDLSRENIMKQVASLKDFRYPLMLPGGAINTSPTNFEVNHAVKLQRFNGKTWDILD